MQITIHRGMNQIDGCMTEIQTSTTRIFIDVGSVDEPNDYLQEQELFEILRKGGETCNAFFLTHYHSSLINLVPKAFPQASLYIGDATKHRLKAVGCTEKNGKRKIFYYKDLPKKYEYVKTFFPLEKIIIDDITVTPIKIEHSIYDYHIFLIEAEGKRLLHMGAFSDIYKKESKLVKKVKSHIRNIDLLIVEGIFFSNEKEISKFKLKQKAKKLLKTHKHVNILCPLLHIDTQAIFHSVIPKSRYVCSDARQREHTHVLQRHNKEISKRYKFLDRRLPPLSFSLINKQESEKLFKEQGCIIFTRVTEKLKWSMNLHKLDSTIIIYAMSKYYLEKDQRFVDFIEGYETIHLHTSGGVTPKTLENICKLINPNIGIIPIHVNDKSTMEGLTGISKLIYLQNQGKFEI